MKGCTALMKGVYCYLFIHCCCIQLVHLASRRNSRCFEGEKNKTKFFELSEGYIYSLVPEPHSARCLFRMQIAVGTARAAAFAAQSQVPAAFCLQLPRSGEERGALRLRLAPLCPSVSLCAPLCPSVPPAAPLCPSETRVLARV